MLRGRSQRGLGLGLLALGGQAAALEAQTPHARDECQIAALRGVVERGDALCPLEGLVDAVELLVEQGNHAAE